LYFYILLLYNIYINRFLFRILLTGIIILSGKDLLFASNTDRKFHYISIDQGLSQNMITAISQDSKGFMWFGTKDGLNRYDGYSFKIYKSDPSDSTTISDNHITAVYKDEQSNLWIGTRTGGLNLYDEENDNFIRIKNEIFGLKEFNVKTIAGTAADRLWMLTMEGKIYGLRVHKNKKNGKKTISLIKTLDEKELGNTGDIVNILLDKKHQLWVLTKDHLFIYDNNNNRISRTPHQFKTTARNIEYIDAQTQKRASTFLKPDLIGIFSDEDGNMWIASNIGVYRYDLKNERFDFFPLGGWMSTANTVKKSNGDIEIWAVDYQKRLLILNTRTNQTKAIKFSELTEKGLSDGMLKYIYKGTDGTVWLGSNGRGLFYYSPYYSLFRNGMSDLSEKIALPSNSIYNIYSSNSSENDIFIINTLMYNLFVNNKDSTYNYDDTYYGKAVQQDSKGNIWLGSTPKGLFKIQPDSYRKEIIDSTEHTITGIFIDKNDQIWYVTPSALKSYHPQTKKFRKFYFNKGNEKLDIHAQQALYTTLAADKDGDLWIGTINGLYHFSIKEEKFTAVFRNDPANIQTLSSSEIKSILPDGKYLWIGTPVGLNRMNIEDKTFLRYSTAEGLPNNTVYGILADNNDNLWLSTNQGLSVFNKTKQTFTNFDVNNGLQGNEFNTGAYFKSSNGEMFFGGVNGLNRFYPEQISIPEKRIPIVISGIDFPGLSKERIPKISLSSPNRLQHTQNHISITLSSLDFAAPEKIRYAYRIFNHDSTWINLGGNRNVTLTNLSPGKYIFQAKGTDSFGRWGTEITEIVFVISPPWWNSVWAKMGYLIIFILVMYYLRYRYKKKIIEQNKIENERKQAAAIRKLDKMKSRFLTNITHEFRTPLTLIKGYIERMKDDPEASHLDDMENNSDRLLQLINQLMDLAKLESGAYQLQFQQDDILSDFKVIIASFHFYAEQNDITLNYRIDENAEQFLSSHPVIYSKEAFWTIFSNLLSNACKYTPEGGEIKAVLSYDISDKRIRLSVSDTGSGIPEDDIDKIFDRFFQSSPSLRKTYEGSGVGLSLVKELAELHGGKVSVSNNADTGCCFLVELTEAERPTAEVWTATRKESLNSNHHIYAWEQSFSGNEQPLILIVEDHQELRKFIRESLSTEYRFAEAGDGLQGMKLATELIPDIIISDVMMPGMDGMEFCKSIKNTDLTSHIPVILLTAKADQEDKISGLEIGADDYLTKPFSARELRLRIQNKIRELKILREKFSTVIAPQTTEDIEVLQDEFILKATRVLEQHLSDSQFGVEELSAIMNISVSQLKRKIKATTGFTTIAFINQYKMERAMEMLKADKGTISVIAYKLGYEDASYFARVFKKHFGVTPSEVS